MWFGRDAGAEVGEAGAQRGVDAEDLARLDDIGQDAHHDVAVTKTSSN